MRIQCINFVKDEDHCKCTFCKKTNENLHINLASSYAEYHIHICEKCFMKYGQRVNTLIFQ
jgi:hypothetical protein